MKRFVAGIGGIFFALMSNGAGGATISWGTPQDITADTDVPNVTYGYQALNAAGSESVTLNNAIFSPAADISIAGNKWSDFGDATALSPAYRKLLKSGRWYTTSITLNHLKVGSSYRVVVWSSDARTYGASGRTTTLDGVVTLDENVGDQPGNAGQYVIGTFTADSDTQTISVSSATGDDHALVNAVLCYEINPTVPPAPGTTWTPPTPVRWWRWHGGTNWAPNGIDQVYRIEEAWRGGAIHAKTDGTPIEADQFAMDMRARFRFEDAGNGYWRIYYLDGSTRYYLGATSGGGRKPNIEICEINLFDASGNAISLAGASATQSSLLWNSGNYVASKAIDGDKDTFSSTSFETHPWFKLDLGGTKTIESLRIYVRRFLNDRFRNAYVALQDASGNTVWSTNTYGSRTVYIFEFPSAINARYLYAEHDFTGDTTPYIYSTTGTGGDEKLWKIEMVDPRGFYRILNKQTGQVIECPETPGPDLRAEGHIPLRLAAWNPSNPRTMRWTIEPVRDEQVDCLGVPQIGWTPKAPKYAVLVRRTPLSSNPEFVVSEEIAGSTDRRVVLSGYARYWGSNYSNLYFYVANLSDLQEEGDYWIDCDGDRADIHIADDAYYNFRFRGGTRVTHLSEMVGGTGFVGYWARIDEWTPLGADSLDEPYWKVDNDFYTDDEYVLVQPREHIPDAYMAGWDHTDRIWNHLPPVAFVLRQLVLAWENAEGDAALREALRKEIDYGVDYVLNTQFSDGSWALSTELKNKLTGTAAAMASALAAAYPVVATYDSAKASQVLSAAKDGWNWIQAHPHDWVNISYRHGHAEDLMILALELYRITGDSTYGNVAHDMITNATIKANGVWGKSSGTFEGENSDDRNTAQALVFEMRYLPEAPADVRTAIWNQLRAYYNYLLGLSSRNGAFGSYEGGIWGYAPNSKWVRRAAYFYRLYDLGGQEFGVGYYVAERMMDWVFGANPYATSCTYGFGDVFAIPGWVRGYDIGSILPGITRWHKDSSDPWIATTTHSTYGNGESEAGLGVALIRALEWRDALRDNPPQTVTFYPWGDYRGYPIDLPAGGGFNADQLKAFGVPLNDLTSISLPPGFQADLSDGGNFDGVSKSIMFSSPGLSDFNNMTESVRIFAGPWTYTTWATAAGLDASNNAETADPDGDGFNNLVEYTFGTDPLVYTTSIGNTSRLEVDASGQHIYYTRNSAAADLQSVVEGTDRLDSNTVWTTLSGSTQRTDMNGTIETIRMDLSLTNRYYFFRTRTVKP